jgi:hypothetical protein
MSYKTPTIATLTLKGLDAKIQDIQTLMANGLSWLENSFALAERIVEMRSDKPYIYPAVFVANLTDPIPMMPGDAWSSFCFWIRSGDTSFEYKTNFAPKDPMVKCKVSCIFYMDIKKIDNVLTYKETKSKIVEDILNFFGTLHFPGMLVPQKFIEDDIVEVFKGFTTDQLDNKFKMYPKWACRMDFELSYRNDCYTVNTYSTT